MINLVHLIMIFIDRHYKVLLKDYIQTMLMWIGLEMQDMTEMTHALTSLQWDVEQAMVVT